MNQKKNLNHDAGSPIVMVWTTVNGQADAQKMAIDLVESRLAACVQIDGPITSVYRWKTSVEIDSEVRLLIKTTLDSLDHLRRWITENHPYEEPELVVTPVMTASPGYTQWVVDQTST